MSGRRGSGERHRGDTVVIAGGGTGGHIYPGLAVAGVLSGGEGDSGLRAHFVVSQRPLDREIVTGAGFEATGITARGFSRRSVVADLAAAGALVRGVAQCRRVLRRQSPKVVLAQGGYVSAACALAARLRRIPVVVLEANAEAGAANRLAARWAVSCAVAFENTPLRGAVVTGLPVRAEIARLACGEGSGVPGGPDREAARAALGIDAGRRLVLVIGGSQGSRRLNGAVGEACALLADRGDLAVRHVLGHRDAASGEQPSPGDPPDGLLYQAVAYEHDMPAALTAADLVVGRAGGGALAELAAVGRAAILVPLAGAAGDHQSANAAAAAAAGAAVVVPEPELDGALLARRIGDLLGDRDELARMENSAVGLARPGAARAVAELVLAAAGSRSGR